MASAGDIHSILYKGHDILKQREPTYDASRKIRRYFPGKIPEYASSRDDEDDHEDTRLFKGQESASEGSSATSDVVGTDIPHTPRITESVESVSIHERRLRLLKNIENDNDTDGTSDSNGSILRRVQEGVAEISELTEGNQLVRKRRRQVIEQGTVLEHRAAVDEGEDLAPSRRAIARPILLSVASNSAVVDSETSGKNDEGDRDTARERIRTAALELRRREEDEVMSALAKKLESKSSENASQAKKKTHSDNSSSSDDESESDDDLNDLDRPMFIPSAKREALREQRELEIAAKENEKREKEEQERRQRESKELLISMIATEEEEERLRLEAQEKGSWDPDAMPDDDDAVNEEAEYELWKIREMQRIIRNRQESIKRDTLLAEVEARRTMTEEERREDDRRLDALQPKKETSSKYGFMQKYYHKGAFFQDLAASGEESLYLRDVNVPVGEDAVDKKLLPQPMRLRRGQFGKAGQVKHTHLADVDTTDYTAAWYQSTSLQKKTRSKMAGYKGEDELDRPAARKKH